MQNSQQKDKIEVIKINNYLKIMNFANFNYFEIAAINPDINLDCLNFNCLLINLIIKIK